MNELYTKFLFDYVNGNYKEDFNLTAEEVAKIVKSILLGDYVQETLDSAIADELDSMGKLDY